MKTTNSWLAAILCGGMMSIAVSAQNAMFFVFNDPSWDYSHYDVANARKDARLAATLTLEGKARAPSRAEPEKR